MITHKQFILLALIGLLLRLILISIPGFKIDVSDWFAWSTRLNEVGLSKFYNPQIFSDYMPGYMYILFFLGWLKSLLHLSNNGFYLLLKMPAILAEIIIGILVYKEIIKKLSKPWAVIASSFVFLNPALIFNSSIWGQIDSILSLSLIVAIYFLNEKRYILSSIMLGLSFLIKPQTIAIFPIFALFIFKNFKMKNFLKLLIPFLITIFILSYPFFTNNVVLELLTLISKTANQYSYTSLFAYNFWGIVGFWINDNTLWNNISYTTIGYFLFTLYWLFTAYFYFKKKISLYALAAIACLGFYFLPTKVHERYLYPSIIFLILTATFYKSRFLFILTTLLSLIHLLNLYFVYIYYNQFYLKLPSVLYSPIIYNFLAQNGKIFSLVSLIIFALISINIIKYNENIKKN